MSTQPKLKFLHSPERTYPGLAQNNYVGAQDTAGRRGALPTFDNTNSYFISKTGSDSNAGTEAAPFKTLAKVFSPTSNLVKDCSGVGGNLIEAGSVPQSHWPCFPIPISGDYQPGPFSSTNYLTGDAALCTALSGLTELTIGFWFYVDSWSTSTQDIFDMRAGAAVTTVVTVNSDGSVAWNLNSTLTTSATGLVVPGQWYYMAVVLKSSGTGSKQGYLGPSPETVVSVLSSNATHTTGAITSVYIGRSASTSSRFLDGYLSRLTISNVARTSFPTPLYSTGATVTAGIIGAYYFQALPLALTAPKSYVVIQDSETYQEGLRCNFPHEKDTAATIGIYAADGEIPTMGSTRGATPGTYGANNPARALYSLTPDYYVSKTGSDSNAGTTSGAPFLTIQKALTTIGATTKNVEILDNGVYTENLTPIASIGIQASIGKSPILRPVTILTPIISGAASARLHLYGLTLDALGVGDIITGNAIMTFSDCTISNGDQIHVGGGGQCVLNNCLIRLMTGFTLQPAVPTNCYFDYPRSGASNYALTLVQSSIIADHCTFNYLNLSCPANAATSAITNCLFTDANLILLPNGGSSAISYAHVAFNTFTNGSIHINQISANTIGRVLIYGNIVSANGADFGIKLTYSDGQSNQYGIYNNVVNGALINYLVSGSPTASSWKNNTSIRATTIALDSPAVLSCTGFLDSSSTLIGGLYYRNGIVPTSSGVHSILSSSSETENATASAEDAAIFGLSPELDIGVDYADWNLQLPNFTLNGLLFDGPINGPGGVQMDTVSGSVSYCTFAGLGTWGLKLNDSTSASYCAFLDVNGHAIKNRKSGSTLANNVVSNAAGVGMLNYGSNLTNDRMSAYSCQAGQFDLTTSIGTVSNCLFAASGLYDYVGDNTLTYSSAGTLDPARSGSVDANSIRTDPLFRDPSSNDLRLMALAAGSLFDSPAIGLASDGSDMGAYNFTYGDCQLDWIEIDLATVTPGGKNYRNPDSIQRDLVAVQLAENERTDGNIDSSAAAYKVQYTCAWSESNDMPLEQMIELFDMFKATSNELRVQIGGAWISARLVKSSGFVYAENSELGFTDASLPTPLEKIIFREV